MSTTKLATVASEQVLLLASPAVVAEMDRAFPGLNRMESTDGFDPQSPVVLVGDSVELFQPVVRKAVDDGRARVVFVLGANPELGGELPAEAAGFPIFGFL